MSDVTNGIGGVESIGDSASYVTVSSGLKSAMTVKVWNTGSETLYATVNTSASGTAHTEAAAVPIPAGESFWFVGQPIKTIGFSSTATGTTANWGAF